MKQWNYSAVTTGSDNTDDGYHAESGKWCQVCLNKSTGNTLLKILLCPPQKRDKIASSVGNEHLKWTPDYRWCFIKRHWLRLMLHIWITSLLRN